MTTKDDVVAEARRWIGTPYLHQASCLGAGTDCLGLIRGIWRSLVGSEPEVIPHYTQDWSEPNHEEVLRDAAMRWLVPKPLTAEDLGDVLLFRMIGNSVAKHLGIASRKNGHPTFIHAYSDHSVVETSLTAPWARKIVGRFEFPLGAK